MCTEEGDCGNRARDGEGDEAEGDGVGEGEGEGEGVGDGEGEGDNEGQFCRGFPHNIELPVNEEAGNLCR